jgi:hypothetical protein
LKLLTLRFYDIFKQAMSVLFGTILFTELWAVSVTRTVKYHDEILS